MGATLGLNGQDILDKNLKTIYDLFLEKNYNISMFSNPNERNTGMFPNNILDMDIHNHDFDLKSYLSKIKLTKNHLLFISLPDFHWSFDDNGYTTYGESKAYYDINKSFVILNNMIKMTLIIFLFFRSWF